MRDFASFLEDIVEPPVKPALPGEDFSDDAAAAAPSIPFGFVGGGPADPHSDSGPETAAAAYLGLNAGWARGEALPETAPDAIARELALHRAADVKALDRLRREFAFKNHPDRVRPEWRDAAMARMQTANRLIDEAKQRLAGKHI
ncbi:MAG: hypothetical protein L0I29_19485 [Hyphomicrobiales bacterium]|nr:hypothetical protein [Hyphomicrobiales bacterium]